MLLPQLISMATVARYLVVNAALGVAVGSTFGLALAAADALGVGTLIAAGPDALATGVIVVVGGATTFAPLVVATAVGLLRDGEA